MSNLKVQASPTGTGVVTLVPPTTNTDRTVTLPDQTGTVYITGGDIGTPSAAVLTNATGLPLSTGVTGTLAVANGGTGVTTSTGTGSVVLSNSPTLVTPALGTPSSGNGSNLTNLNASNLSSGTVPDARFPATLPAASGANLTNLNASNLASGTVGTARLGSGTANSTTFLRGDGTWATAGGAPASIGDIGAVLWVANGTTSNLLPGNTVAGSSLFYISAMGQYPTYSVPSGGPTYYLEGNQSSNPRTELYANNSVYRRSGSGNPGFSIGGTTALSGTWRILTPGIARSYGYDGTYNNFNSNAWNVMAVRIS